MEPLSKTRERRTATPVARYSTTSTTSIKKPTMKQKKGYVASVAVEPTRGGHVEGEDSTRYSAVLDAPRDRVPYQLHPP